MRVFRIFKKYTQAQQATAISNISNNSNAATGNVLSVYKGCIKRTGIMPNQGAHNIIPGASNVTIPQGYHSGDGVVYGEADLVAGNVAPNPMFTYQGVNFVYL